MREAIAAKTGDELYLEANEHKIGYPKAGVNKFASCIRIVIASMSGVTK